MVAKLTMIVHSEFLWAIYVGDQIFQSKHPASHIMVLIVKNPKMVGNGKCTGRHDLMYHTR